MSRRTPPLLGLVGNFVGGVGEKFYTTLERTGGAWKLFSSVVYWCARSLADRRIRLGRAAIITQLVRVGVQSIFIISLVSFAVGFILALQIAPTLDELGSIQLIPDILSIAIFRELGPLIAAIVMTGFAGAAIAAELGTMVVGEEVEALEAGALNPVRFLVVPRVIATVVSLVVLATLANFIGVAAGGVMGVYILGIPPSTYIDRTLAGTDNVDFITGIIKAGIFGLLIALIACLNGLRVTQGAAGVGRATTATVVQSVVAIIMADLLFTTMFYFMGLN